MARKTNLERFTEKVQINTGCWLWVGCILKGGYGQGYWDGRKEYAHRISFQIYKGEITEGLQIDHLCRNKTCVNPDHLELVTPKENVLRCMPFRKPFNKLMSSANAKKTHCKRGHPLEGENLLMVGKDKTFRGCRACRKACITEWKKARRAASTIKNNI